MKFVRSIFGGGAGSPEADEDESSAGSIQPSTEDEAARELELAREFDRGLSDFQRQQLQRAKYAPQAPSETNRRGRWYLTEPVEAPEEGGQTVALETGVGLEFVRQLEAPPGAGSVSAFQFRLDGGGLVTIETEADEEWPAMVVRVGDLPSGERG